MTKRALKRELSPVIRFADKPGSVFIGVLTGKRDSQFGAIYSFAFESTTADVVRKVDDKLVPANVKAGDEVAVFASTILNDLLSMAEEGERVEITFKGKVKSKNGRSYNSFEASVLE